MASFERPAINSFGRVFMIISVDRLSELYYQSLPTFSMSFRTLSVRLISSWTSRVLDRRLRRRDDNRDFLWVTGSKTPAS